MQFEGVIFWESVERKTLLNEIWWAAKEETGSSPLSQCLRQSVQRNMWLG